jgi:WD40 repeat protein
LFAFNPTLPVFVGLNAKKVLTLFSTGTGEPIRSLDFALGKKVKCVCFSPDGLTCAVGGSNKQFAIFDIDV